MLLCFTTNYTLILFKLTTYYTLSSFYSVIILLKINLNSLKKVMLRGVGGDTNFCVGWCYCGFTVGCVCSSFFWSKIITRLL